MELAKLVPTLPVAYDRPIGQPWTVSPYADYPFGSQNSMGQLFVFPEYLVPGTGDNEMSLTALANSIYIAAREANMSLSAYGHYDPAKFVLAATYIALRMEEIRRTLSMLGRYQFGNRTEGEVFSRAMTGQSLATNIAALPNFVLRYNFIITRVNQLFIPTLEILKRWLPHRCYVYKDDEGERYQYYCYCMANWYKLDTNASSATVGQLLCEFIGKQDLQTALTEIENTLISYEEDDDFVNFAVEAAKAQLPRLNLDPITVTNDSIQLPELKTKFDIDDVLSLENAYFINPVYTNHVQMLTAVGMLWDIKEDINTGKFLIGKMNSTYDVLPIMHPLSVYSATGNGSIVAANSTDVDPIVRRPFFAHAKITNPDTLSIWSRYIGACSESPVAPNSTIIATLKWFKDRAASALAISGNITTQTFIAALTTHSDVMLGRPSVYYDVQGTAGEAHITLAGSYMKDASSVLPKFNGFKGTPYLYQLVDAGGVKASTPVYHDFDYVVRLEDGTLNLFNSAIVWNNFGLIGKVSPGHDSNGSRSASFKKKKK